MADHSKKIERCSECPCFIGRPPDLTHDSDLSYCQVSGDYVRPFQSIPKDCPMKGQSMVISW